MRGQGVVMNGLGGGRLSLQLACIAFACSRVVHPLAFPVHPLIAFGSRLFGRTTLIRNLAHTFLFGWSGGCGGLVFGRAFGVGYRGKGECAQGDSARGY